MARLGAPSVAASLTPPSAVLQWGHCTPKFVGWIMRAEAEQLAESIKQSVGLLRRHL